MVDERFGRRPRAVRMGILQKARRGDFWVFKIIVINGLKFLLAGLAFGNWRTKKRCGRNFHAGILAVGGGWYRLGGDVPASAERLAETGGLGGVIEEGRGAEFVT